MRVLNTLIADGWEVAERIPAGRDLLFSPGGERDWLPAQVPGHVHLDLMRAGVIGDPFYRMQERACRWVDEADWTYRTTIAVDAERLASRGRHGRHFLVFHGLDTLARVFVNGALVGRPENAFVAHRFDVTDALREGDNELRVEFDSALRVGNERARAYLGDGATDRGKQSYFNFGPRAFVRKPQYMFGWDWGPELVSCGLWQKVELVTVPVARIMDFRHKVTFLGKGENERAVVEIEAFVERVPGARDTPLTLRAAFTEVATETWPFEDDVLPDAQVVSIPLGGKPIQGARVSLTIPKPRRWWPNGMNPADAHAHPPLYRLCLTVGDQTGQTDELVAHIGLRTVELIREPDLDKKGEGFKFRVNGVDTFIKGANWIPDDSFPSRLENRPDQHHVVADEGRITNRIYQACDAGFNMLRVWGGGLYESDHFYEMCDAHGILVWQDFPFACSMYPDDDPAFVANVRREATEAIRRIRNHASLALWCGGNENVQLFEDKWDGATQAKKFYGARLIHDVLPAVVKAEALSTPYWPNSPFGGGGNGNSEDFGDSHYWRVWHSQGGSTGDWTHYEESDCRFSSEFGFASPCGHAAWESATTNEDRGVRSPVARWHDKTRKGYETYLGYIARHFPVPQSFDDLIYYGQANQAEALKCGVEHWRRRKGHCWGTLFWQFNDCWPVQSWAIVDSAGEPKAAYYAAKRFYAPLLLSLKRDGETIAAHLVNDTGGDVSGVVALRVLSFDGEELARVSTNVVAPANAASGAVANLSLPPFVTENDHAADVFVHASFTGPNGDLLAENFRLLAEPKDLRLPDPGLSWKFSDVDEEGGTATLAVTARRFAPFVFLRLVEEAAGKRLPVWSDNWFHLAPGQTRVITLDLPKGMAAGALRAGLWMRSL